MTKIINIKASILEKQIKKIFKHDEVIVLKLEINYPHIALNKNSLAQLRINSSFNDIAKKYYDHSMKTLVPSATQDYVMSIKDGFPFNPYEVLMNYTVTLNSSCTLSTYFDQYNYTGGAHGNTLRISKTFSLNTGNIIKLKDFFKNKKNYKEFIISLLQDQASKNLVKNPGIYFENYKELIEKNFKEENFYLTPNTINFYFQQYDIAPYSTGIVVFEIPYSDLKISKPTCFK
ncbi:MAG: DUF3298 and DUF4163 domain-containing protein [Clostridia bacterium]|nr:DUF3298 and DUF4163 domain-containing protein [Clostridia bacterium]